MCKSRLATSGVEQSTSGVYSILPIGVSFGFDSIHDHGLPLAMLSLSGPGISAKVTLTWRHNQLGHLTHVFYSRLCSRIVSGSNAYNFFLIKRSLATIYT